MSASTYGPSTYGPSTYGGLMDRAVLELAGVAAATRVPRDGEELVGLAVGMEAVRRQVGRHLRLAVDWRALGPAGRSGSDPSVGALAAALHRPWLACGVPPAVDPPPRWAAVATRVGAAADLVWTHVGPDGQWLTPDARTVADAAGRAELARRGAELAETLADLAGYLSRAGRPGWGGGDEVGVAQASVWFEAGLRVAAAARGVLDRTDGPGRPGVGDSWVAAPLLRPEPVTDLDSMLAAFDRLRRMSHAHRVGTAPAGVATVRGYAALGYAVTGTVWVAHRALSESGSPADHAAVHAGVAEAARVANAAWGRVHGELADVRDTGVGPPGGWRADLSGVCEQLRLLAGRDPARFPAGPVSGPADSERLGVLSGRLLTAVATLAADQRAVVRRLAAAGGFYLPTAQLPELDVPRRYAPMPTGRCQALGGQYADLVTACRAAAAVATVAAPAGQRPARVRSRTVETVPARSVRSLDHSAEVSTTRAAAQPSADPGRWR